MNAHYKLKIFSTLLIVVTLAGCAGGKTAFKSGNHAELTRDYETAMSQYKKALDAEPGNTEYRLKYEQTRFAAAFDHFQKGKLAMEQGALDTAKTEFGRAVELDPSHDFASQELARVNDLIAGRKPGGPVASAPDFDSIKLATRTASYQSQLEPTLKGNITIKLTQPTRTAFETLADMAGIHVIFNRDLRFTTPPTVTLDLDNVSIFQAMDLLCLQTKTFWQVINKNTIYVLEDNTTMRRDYEDVVLKVIYLTNATSTQEVNDIMNAIRQSLNMTQVMAYTALNAIMVRDSPDKVAMAEKLAASLDKGKGEVVIEATIMEVDRSLLRQLGIQPPSSSNVTFVPGGSSATAALSSTTTSTPSTIRDLGNINSGSFALNIPQSVANFLARSSLTTLIQNPQVRATSGQQATLLIGSNIPIQTSNTQPTLAGGSATTAVSYTNVGVTLVITPIVLLNRDISVTVNVDVKAPAGDKQVGNTVSPSFTDRNVQHVIRLKEGETNVLGGIISSTESTSMTGLPILKDIPVLKYFFGEEVKSRDDVEVIIMLTPHIIHMPEITADDMRAMDVGSITNPRLPSLTSPGPNATEPPQPRGAGTTGTPSPAGPGAPVAPTFGAPVQPVQPVQPNTAIPAPQNPIGALLTAPASAQVAQAVQATPAPPAPGVSAAISFSASPSVMASQKATPVNIMVNGTDISGAELTLSYDPNSIAISQIGDGGFLSRDGQIIAVVQRIESEARKAHITIERPRDAAALAGSGNLVTLMVVPQNKKGDSTLRVTEFKLHDAHQNQQMGALAETKITVQ